MVKKVLLIGGVAVVALGALAPYGTGILAQSSLESMIGNMEAEGFGQVEVVDLDRGWFSSTLKLNYTPPGTHFLGKGDALPLDVKLSHGPIIWSSNGVGLGLAEAVAVPDFSELEKSGDNEKEVAGDEVAESPSPEPVVAQESTLQRLNTLLGGNQDSLSVVATFGFSGEVDASLVLDHVESNTMQGDRITFEGGTISAAFNDEGMTGQGHLELGALKVDKGASVFTMSPFKAMFDFEQQSPGLYLGMGNATIDQVSVESATNALTIKAIGIETERTMVESKVEDKTVVSLGAIEAPLPVTSANLVQVWKGVNPEAFAMFQGGLWGDEGLTPEESQERIKQSVNALLQPGFSYGLNIELNSEASSAKADLNLGFVGTLDGSEPFDFMTSKSQQGIAGMGAILQTLSGELEVMVDEAFIGAIGPFAGMFMQPPYFEKKEATFVAKGVLADGVLTMNGTPMPMFPSQQPAGVQAAPPESQPNQVSGAELGYMEQEGAEALPTDNTAESPVNSSQ